MRTPVEWNDADIVSHLHLDEYRFGCLHNLIISCCNPLEAGVNQT